MSAKIFSIVSPKGGSGKTITGINLARVLAGLQKKVLLIDADASTNGLSLFFLDRLVAAKRAAKMETGGVRVLGSFELEDQQSATPVYLEDNFAVVPATFSMSQTEHVDPNRFDANLRNTISALEDDFDYIFLDAQAGTDQFASISIENSTEVIVVSEYDPMSAQGIERMRILFQKQIANKPVWVLFNKVLPEFTSALGDFLAVARYLNPIPWDADVVRAYVRRRSPIDMTRGNLHTMAVMQTALSLLGGEIEEEVEQWKAAKERAFKEPSKIEVQEIEDHIRMLEEMKIQKHYSEEDFERRSRSISIGFAMALATLLGINYFFAQRFLEKSLPVTLGFIVTGLVVVIFLGYFGPILRNRLFRHREVELRKEITAIEAELENLKERRGKYRSILESDITNLLRKR